MFDMLKCEIRRRWSRINNELDLIREIHDVIKTRVGLSGFDRLFAKCGYRRNEGDDNESDIDEDEEVLSVEDGDRELTDMFMVGPEEDDIEVE